MSTSPPRILLRLKYEEAAQAYLRSLPLEHFMESTPQATQRQITLESFDLVKPHRPDLHVFNELLVQYPRPRGGAGGLPCAVDSLKQKKGAGSRGKPGAGMGLRWRRLMFLA